MVSRQRQTWSMNQDVLLCREILIERPYQHTKGSKESASGWTRITDRLNAVFEDVSHTNIATRDHFKHLLTKRKAQKNAEDRASGIAVEEKEIDILLDKILDDMDGCKELESVQNENKRQTGQEYKANAEEIRKIAMETHSEASKRKSEEDDETCSPRQKRRSGTDTMKFLSEINELAKQQHTDEMKYWHEELPVRKEEANNFKNATNIMLQTMQMQMQLQQQQMTQQFQMQQQQMQQQSKMFATLIEKLTK